VINPRSILTDPVELRKYSLWLREKTKLISPLADYSQKSRRKLIKFKELGKITLESDKMPPEHLIISKLVP
jgi:hypothetical protein